MKETKTKTQISEKIAVMVVMISSLALAAGLILGAIQTTKKDTAPVAPEPDTEIVEESGGEAIGMADPSAVYCIEMGGEYKQEYANNQYSYLCKFPDGQVCNVNDFLIGKCAINYSYCEQNGYNLIIKDDGNNGYSKEYAVCVDKNTRIEKGSVTDLTNLYELSLLGGVELSNEEVPLSNEEMNYINSNKRNIPTSFSWRDYQGLDWLTPINQWQMQGDSGTCWSFALTGALESAFNIQTNNADLDYNLSEQYFITNRVLSKNCCGSTNVPVKYATSIGIPFETSLPFSDGSNCVCSKNIDKQSVCPSNDKIYRSDFYMPFSNLPTICSYSSQNDCLDTDGCGYKKYASDYIESYGSPIDGVWDLWTKNLILSYGPVTSAMHKGDYGDFDANGIYRCNFSGIDGNVINHGILIYGWNDEDQYWLAKNSHSDSPVLKIGYGECGIGMKPNFNTVIKSVVDTDMTICGTEITSDTTLINDIGPCDWPQLNVTADNVTLDCDGHTIHGTVLVNGADNTTVKNCVFESDSTTIYHAIEVSASSGVILENNTFNLTEQSSAAIFVEDTASNTNIINNSISGSGIGIITDGSNTEIDNNNFSGLSYGIVLYPDAMNTKVVNNVNLNCQNVGQEGIDNFDLDCSSGGSIKSDSGNNIFFKVLGCGDIDVGGCCNRCTGSAVCDEVMGECKTCIVDADCDDGDSCTIDTCEEAWYGPKCSHDTIANTCGDQICGNSPDGCFLCGSCQSGEYCVNNSCTEFTCTSKSGTCAADCDSLDSLEGSSYTYAPYYCPVGKCCLPASSGID